MVDVDRLNWLLQAAVLGFDPEPLTVEEREAFVRLKADVDANPDVVWSPLA